MGAVLRVLEIRYHQISKVHGIVSMFVIVEMIFRNMSFR